MTLSRVRLDPLETVREMRGYKEPVDTSLPLEQMTHEWMATGLVTIIDEWAYVSKVRGPLTHGIVTDFYDQMRGRGVKRVIWQKVNKETRRMERVEVNL